MAAEGVIKVASQGNKRIFLNILTNLISIERTDNSYKLRFFVNLSRCFDYHESTKLYLMKHRLFKNNDIMMFINKHTCPEKLVKDIAMQIIRSMILLTSHQAIHKEYCFITDY